GIGLARLRPDGTLDHSFSVRLGSPNPSDPGPGYVTAISLQSDGSILILGEFNTVNGVSRNRFARLLADQTFPNAMILSSPNYTVAENEAIIAVSVLRLGDSEGTVTVGYSTSDGTASAGRDYVTQSGVLTFAPLEVEKTISI